MNKQASREPFRVRIESVPVWLPWGLALLGLIGSLISAHLFLADWYAAPAQLTRPIETNASGSGPPPSESQVVQGEDSTSSGLANEPATISGNGNDRQPAATGTGHTVTQAPENLIASESSPEDTDAHEAELHNTADMSGSTVQATATRQGAGAPTPIQQQIHQEPDREADAQATAIKTGDRPSPGVGSVPDLPVEADAVESDSLSSRTDAQTPPIGTTSESQTTPAPSSAESLQAQDSRRTSQQDNQVPTIAPQAQYQHQAVAESEHGIDETPVDCAPLFSVSFNHGSTKPQAHNMEEKVTRLARWLAAHPAAILYVDGHADSSGSEEINLVISFRRAVATAALLTKAGAARSQLVVRAYGEGKTLSPSAQSQPERRVTLTADAGTSCGQRTYSDGGLQ